VEAAEIKFMSPSMLPKLRGNAGSRNGW